MCPLYNTNYDNETFLESWYSHYRNGHLPMPLLQTPSWIIQGINILSFIHKKLTDEETKESQNNLLKQRIY